MFGENIYVMPGKYLTSIGIYGYVSFFTRKGRRAESQEILRVHTFFVWNEKYR